MDRTARILRPVVFFGWAVPIFIGLGARFEGTWPAYLAYVVAAIMAAAALAAGWQAYRATRGP